MDIIEFLEARVADDEHAAIRELTWGTTPTLTRMTARVLDECTAKRELIELVRPYLIGGVRNRTAEVLTIVAAVYKDHPDYPYRRQA